MDGAIQWLLDGDPAIRWQTLRDLGLAANNRQAQKACRLLLDRGLQRDGGINYGWRGRSETCITGMVLSILSHFRYDDLRLNTIANHLLKAQMSDGGWNCRRPLGATHASMNITISVLEGLRLFELHRAGDARALRAAQRRGREFPLARHRPRSPAQGRSLVARALVQRQTYFALERIGMPSRWNTLRALRVLKWWDREGP